MSHEQCTTSARHSTCDTDIFPVPFAVSGISLRVLVLNEQPELVLRSVEGGGVPAGLGGGDRCRVQYMVARCSIHFLRH